MAIVTELVTVFSFKGSLNKLDKFRGGVKSSIKLLGGFALATGAAVAGLIGLTSMALKSAEAVGQLSRETGDSVEELQRYGFAASVSGSSVEALSSSVTNLSAKIGEAAQNGSEEFSRLGINIRHSNGQVKTSLQVIESLRVRFKQLGLSIQEQRKFTDALGIDASLIQLLGKTSSEMAKLKKRASDLGILTKKETDSIIAYNDSMTTLRFGSKALQQQFALALTPEIKRLSEDFTGLLEGSEGLIKDGFEKIIDVSVGVISAIGRVATLIFDIIDVTIGWRVALALIVATLLIVLAPIYSTIAASVVLLAAVDDLIVAFNGGKSVIRDFFLEFLGFDITPMLKSFVDGFILAVAVVKSIFVDLFGFIGRGFSQIFDVVSSIVGGISGLFGSDSDGGTTQPGATGSPLALGPTASTSLPVGGNTTSIVQDVNINVETNDPNLAGRTINQALQDEYRTAAQQTGLGGR